MKKNYFFIFILTLCFSVISFAQTQPTVHNSTFDKIAKAEGSDCSCAGWINKSLADQGESSTTDGNDVVKLDNVESDGVYQEVAVEANSDYTLDLDVKWSSTDTTTEYLEIVVLKGSGYVADYTPAYAGPAEAAQDDFGYRTVESADLASNQLSKSNLTVPGDTEMNAISTISFNTGTETSIAIFIRAVGPYDSGAHGDSGKDKGWMNGDTELRIDNFSLVNLGEASVTDPTEAASTPPSREASDVVSLFSDAYTDVTLSELPTDWSDVTTFEAITVAGDNVWKLSGLEFLGMVTNYDTGIDVSSMEKLHIDYWVPTGVNNELIVKIVNTIDGGEDIESLGTTVSGSWQSIDLDMTGFDGGDLANTEKITQILFDAVERATTVYVDNFYFYKEPVVITDPTEAAPTPPARETEDVVSLFSDAYTDVTLSELPTDWSDVTTFEATTVAGDNVWKLSGLEFLGMVTNYDTGIDVSSMEKLHIDYWVPTGVNNELIVKIVNTIDGGEDIESLGTTVSGSWQSIDLDMTGFDGGDLANTEKITQILFDAVERATTVYVDNFYFYREPSTSSDVIFITELADPNDNAAARYVEIYNGGTSAVDLTGWTLRRYTNGNAEPQTTGEDLSSIGSLAPGAIAIIAASGTAFEAAFGMTADISAGTGGPADSNGDDQIYITDASDTIVDFFGVPGEDGSGTDHEFEDGRAERKASVTQGTATWDVNEWNIDNDGGAGDGALNVDGGFDPGVWIGADSAGVEDESLVTLNMYPNPASDVLNISAQNTINTVEIYNVLGQ
ncbi:lamin tail domain-containing protein, partial [Polaribacter sp.]|nr:lamin tail domain-containing protein [Polaribacter sp.]